MITSQKLGIRVFNYYLSKNISAGILFLVVALIVASSKTVIISKLIILFSLKTTVLMVNYFSNGLIIFAVLVIIGAIIVSWLKYISCSFNLGENAISIQRGILNKKETSIPYRQIQNINIDQTLKHRIMGVSKLVILTAGNDMNDTIGKSEAVFEVIDSKLAQQTQDVILKMTNPTIVNQSHY